jgi:hypothetical protein
LSVVCAEVCPPRASLVTCLSQIGRKQLRQSQ